MSFAPKIAVVVVNHSLLSIRTSDVVERNIIAYLLNDEASNDEGRVVVYHLLRQCVDIDNLLTRRCTDSRWDPVDRMTGCLVALVTCVLHSDDGVVVAVRWVVEHKVSHSNKVEYRRTNDSLQKRTSYICLEVVVRVTWGCRKGSNQSQLDKTHGATTIHCCKNGIIASAHQFIVTLYRVG